MSRRILIFRASAHKLKSHDKASPWFLKQFVSFLKETGLEVEVFRDKAAFRDKIELYRNPILIMAYNETAQASYDEALQIEQLARSQCEDPIVVNSARTGRVVRSKTLTHKSMRRARVPMPEIIAEGSAPVKVFSNSDLGSQKAVDIVRPGERVDRKRYNTAYIDTRYTFEGKEFFVCLRAMAFGENLLATYVRARPADNGDPSVHTRDTPLNANLINELHHRVVAPNHSQIAAICSKAGKELGLGFYSHDLLPEAGSSKIFMCETGFKFDNSTLREHLRPLRTQLPILASLWSDAYSRICASHIARLAR